MRRRKTPEGLAQAVLVMGENGDANEGGGADTVEEEVPDGRPTDDDGVSTEIS